MTTKGARKKMMTKEEFVEAVLSLLEEEIILGGDE